jgi:hypothetical protein
MKPIELPNQVKLIASQDKSPIRDKFERLGQLLNWNLMRRDMGYDDDLINYTWVAFIEALMFTKAANDE